MITKHITPEGEEIEIEWDFNEKEEELRDNWWSWFVLGRGNDGREYGGMCEASGTDPEDLNQGWVDDIEEIDPITIPPSPIIV